MQYVGQTMLRLKDRLKHHFYDIEMNDMNKPVSRHFSQADHNGTKNISVSVVEFIKKTSTQSCFKRSKKQGGKEMDSSSTYTCPLGDEPGGPELNSKSLLDLA
jgi:hypothetical protein